MRVGHPADISRRPAAMTRGYDASPPGLTGRRTDAITSGAPSKCEAWCLALPDRQRRTVRISCASSGASNGSGTVSTREWSACTRRMLYVRASGRTGAVPFGTGRVKKSLASAAVSSSATSVGSRSAKWRTRSPARPGKCAIPPEIVMPTRSPTVSGLEPVTQAPCPAWRHAAHEHDGVVPRRARPERRRSPVLRQGEILPLAVQLPFVELALPEPRISDRSG